MKNEGNLTIGALYNILRAGLFVDRNINTANESGMREALEAILKDPQRTNEMWRAFTGFGASTIELRDSNIGLGGKVQR